MILTKLSAQHGTVPYKARKLLVKVGAGTYRLYIEPVLPDDSQLSCYEACRQ